MLQIGYLNLHLHRIINKAAATMLEEEGLLSSELLPVDSNDELILVRGITISVENGSIIERIRLKIASVFSGENLKRLGRDLAINIAASLIVAEGGHAIKPDQPQPPNYNPPGIERVAPDINRMVRDMASNGGGRLTYRDYTENGDIDNEVIVEIPNKE